MEFWAYFFSALAAIILVINMFSIFMEDKKLNNKDKLLGKLPQLCEYSYNLIPLLFPLFSSIYR